MLRESPRLISLNAWISAAFCLASLIAVPVLPAQTYATVRGVVKDSSAGVVPKASVSLFSVEQGRAWRTQTNASGAYVLQQLPPGKYRLEAVADGFKRFTRSGLALEVAQLLELSVTLELGTVTETVSVTAEAPLLQTADSTLGEVVNATTVDDLPLNGRNTLQLVALVPGITTVPKYRTAVSGNGSIFAVGFSANGGRSLSNMVMLDGSPQEVLGYNQAAYVPTPDALQEFKVQTNALSAEYGRTGGAVVNMVHRSGTSALHGVLYEFLRNDILDANGFFNNRNSKAKAAFRYNQFGFAAGGPLTPSRQTTFFFLNYEGIRQVNPESTSFTLPTARMKDGDFREIANIIYDPQTVDAKGLRSPLPENLVPASRRNGVTTKFLSYYPAPNRIGVVNNFFSQAASRTVSNNISFKIDRRVSERQNLFGRFSWSNLDTVAADHFRGPASPQGRTSTHNRSATLDDTWIVRDWVLHFNYGFGYYADPMFPLQGDVRPSSFGLPSYMDSAVQFNIFPRVAPNGYAAMGADLWSIRSNKFYTHTWSGDASKLAGSHTLKAGGAFRLSPVSNFRPEYPAGSYPFNEVWTRYDVNRAGGGNSIASMLLGLPSTGEVRQAVALSVQSTYGALYFQDDWRISDRLTANLGLRWDADWPLTERFDRASWFDLNARLPLDVPGMGAFYGALVFAGSRTQGAPRGIKSLDRNNFAPRAGLTYKFSKTTVARGGFGVFYNPPVYFGDAQSTGAMGFNAVTAITTSIDGGRTPYATLANPYPDGFSVPENGARGPLTYIGQSIYANLRYDRSAYSMQWNVDLQQELPGSLLVEAAYAGGGGVKLPASSDLNQLADQYLALGSELSKTVSNPFYGILPASSTLGKRTTTHGQLLRPFPWLTGLTHQWGGQAHSTYHSLQIKARKRYANGLQFLLAYTWSKSIDDVSAISTFLGIQNPGYTNANCKRLDKSLSAADVPHRLAFNYQWELPFGKGKQWLSRGWTAHAAGGWTLSGVTTIQSGTPLSINSASNTTGSFGAVQRPNSAGISSRTPGSDGERIDHWFLASAFVDAPAYAFGNVGRFLPDNRGPHLHNWDISALKLVAAGERFRVQFRAEFFNALNQVNFQPPATVFGQPQFGLITAAEPARIIQFGLKFYF